MLRTCLMLLAVVLGATRVALAQGEPLGQEFRVNTYTTYHQDHSSFSADPSGGFVVVWDSQQDGSGSGIFAQRYGSSGAPLGLEFRVNTATVGTQSYPSVGGDSSGNFVVVWTGPDASFMGVFGQRYDSSGVPLGPEFQVNTYTTNYQEKAVVAADSAGNFTVVWPSFDGSAYGIVGQRYANTGAPLGSEFRVNSYTTGVQFYPALAVEPSGNFVVVWTSLDGSDWGVFGRRYANTGAPLDTDFRVNSSTSGDQTHPSVAADSVGNFIVTWQSQDGSALGIFGQRYVGSGTPVGPEFRVNTFTPDLQLNPAVASDASGNFVVTWEGYLQDASGRAVIGQRYASSGAPLGPDFRVNTYTIGDQRSPAVIAVPSGNFVVAWSSEAQDGSGRGIFSQRYGRITPVELLHVHVE